MMHVDSQLMLIGLSALVIVSCGVGVILEDHHGKNPPGFIGFSSSVIFNVYIY